MTIADLKMMLQARIEALAAELAPLGMRRGNVWMARSPLREERRPSFAVWLKGAPGAWKDFGTDEKGDVIDLICACALGSGLPPSREDRVAALAWARNWLGVATTGSRPERLRLRQEAGASAAAREREAQAQRDHKRRRAFDLWLSGVRPRETLVERYLLARQIDARAIEGLAPCLRFKPVFQHPFEPHAGPVMLAKFLTPLGDFAAVHVTFLNRDGSGKADVSRGKIIFGAFGGAAIRLREPLAPEPGPLVICEGIEDGLTIAAARPDWRIWAAGSLGNIGAQPCPAGCTALVVAADQDAKSATIAALERGLAQLGRHGVPVEVVFPGHGAKDFNDLRRMADG
ncbi:MAG: toprim domain-containing protein [Hyphomicrobiales bacterium]|nr:toprim domain-containing protein [Hyphomicrobiales bacterium]